MLGGLIIIGGIIAVVMIHEGGHLIAAKAFGMKATEYFLGFGPRIWSFKRGETEYGIKAIPAGGYVRIIGMSLLEDVAPDEEHRTYRGKPFWQKSIVVMAGVSSHFVLAFLLLWTANVIIGRSEPQLEVERVVEELEDGSVTPAVLAGIQPGDRVVAVAGNEVTTWTELVSQLKPRPGEEVALSIQRGGGTIDLVVTLAAVPDPETGDDIGFLGVGPAAQKVRDGPIEGIATATDGLGTLTAASAEGLWRFFANFGDFIIAVFSNDDTALEDVRPVSPIGLARFGAASEEVGLNVTFELLAFFTVFVGLLNAIPLYPFDGGHFAVAVYERVTGRHPDVRKMVPVAAAVFLLLVLVGILGLYFDIVSPIDLR